MKELQLHSSLDDEAIARIASCVDKIKNLMFDARKVTMHGWKILSTAINKRRTPVS